MLNGLTYRYSGDIEKANPLLLDSKQEFEALLQQHDDGYAIIRSLCFITAGLGDLDGARRYCEKALKVAPKDEFVAGNVKFDSAAGLALAGDAQGSVRVLKAMLEADMGPTIYRVIYHPAFDGIRADAAYIELLEQYGPEGKQP